MATQGIVADTQPFVNSTTSSNLKAIAKSASPQTYCDYLQSLDAAINGNFELIKLLLDQQRLQKIFARISQDKSFNNLEQSEIEYLRQHPSKIIKAFVSKYQTELQAALEIRFDEGIDNYLVRSFARGC